MKTIFTLVAGLMVLYANTAVAQIGGLDTTFGQGGVVETYINDVSEANAEALQSNGKIVVAGYTYDSTRYVFATMRYDTDGAIDTTFGVEGVDTISFQNGSNYATSVVIQNNKKIVVGGYSVAHLSASDSVTIISLVRYDSTGAIDSTFGTNGKVTTLFGSINDRINAITLQPDGKIVATGSSQLNATQNRLLVVRYDTTGKLDSTFNGVGIADTLIGTTTVGHAITVLPNDEIVIAGTATLFGYNDFTLARYTTSGILDVNFGTKGITTTLKHLGINGYAIALQSSGKIIVGGYADYDNSQYEFALARYDTSGVLDPTFGTSGFVMTAVGPYFAQITALAIDTADKIVAGGFTQSKSLTHDFVIARYDSSGVNLDTTFGDTGITITDLGQANAYGQSVLLQPDGKIVQAGYALVGEKGLFVVTRYDIDTSSATVDTNPNDTTSRIVIAALKMNSVLVYPDPAADEATLTYTLVNNETLTIAIYDAMGREVESILTDENMTAGKYEEPLNLEGLPAGIYILRLTNSTSQSLNIKLIKD